MVLPPGVTHPTFPAAGSLYAERVRYHALACDYDGTLATHGRVDDATLAALDRLRASRRKLILVTGRRLPDLMEVFPHADLFDRVVAENGAVVYSPSDRIERTLAEPPPAAFVAALRRRQVSPLALGRVIVATWEPQEAAVLEVIRELGLELQVIFNKGAVMVLPSGVNKASGMDAALADLGLSRHNAVGVGDAENDHAFLARCECSVAVANALPALKQRADLVTAGERGAGVAELIDRLVECDLAELAPQLGRHEIPLGAAGPHEVRLPPYGVNVLLAGTSGSGKSTFATGVLERVTEQEYQFCIVDPEGDYDGLENAVVLGDGTRAPLVKEALELLDHPDRNCVVNLLALGMADRPAFFEELFGALLELRSGTGRPHWIVMDETHHLLPASWRPAAHGPAELPRGLMLITVHPDQVARPVLASVDLVVAIGEAPAETLGRFAATLGEPVPPVAAEPLAAGDAIAWWRRPARHPLRFRSLPPRAERRRHVRKYAEGELGEDKSFFFRGPAGRLNLRAQNLQLFLQLAEGVDDETWSHHLRRGDYSRWFREAIKDDALADEVERIERTPELSAGESRARLRDRVEERYTGSA
jgi:hydroxymethylpyrimidine pyrophosphatase-like HAD family hydrolase